MIDFTKFFKFKKPDGDEFYDVALNNENLDSIDNLLSTHIHDGRYYTEAEVNTHLLNKAPLASPNFTGTPKIAGKEIPTTESGIWAPTFYGAENAGTFDTSVIYKDYYSIGKVCFCSLLFVINSVVGASGDLMIAKLPYPYAKGGLISEFFATPIIFKGAKIRATTNGEATTLSILLLDGITLKANNPNIVSAQPWCINFMYKGA